MSTTTHTTVIDNPVPWLRSGAGNTPQDGGCVMQIVNWITTGGWTDRPRCVHETIQDVAIAANDLLNDRQRQKLLDLVPRMIGTNVSSKELDKTLLRMRTSCGVRLWLIYYMKPLPLSWRQWMMGNCAFGSLKRMLNLYDYSTPSRELAEPEYAEICAVIKSEEKELVNA